MLYPEQQYQNRLESNFTNKNRKLQCTYFENSLNMPYVGILVKQKTVDIKSIECGCFCLCVYVGGGGGGGFSLSLFKRFIAAIKNIIPLY